MNTARKFEPKAILVLAYSAAVALLTRHSTGTRA